MENSDPSCSQRNTWHRFRSGVCTSIAIICIVVVTIVGLFGFQAVSPALPGMRDALDISTQNIGWVMTAYAIPAFIFVPLNSSILSQFKGVNLSQVSGLMNLFRQLGGSIGIAMTGTLLTTRTMQNYMDLANRVSLLDPPTRNQYFGGMAALSGKMVKQLGMGTPNEAVLKSIFGRIMSQAFMMSMLQLVWIVMGLFLVAYVPLYLLQLRFKVGKPVDAH